MSKRLLLSIILVLIITNVATLIFWKDDSKDSAPKSEKEDEHTERVETVATIGDTKISYEDWVSSLQESQGKKHLKNMIDREVVKQLAAEKNIQINEKLIDSEIALLMTMQGVMTQDEVEKEEESLRSDIKHRYLLEALLAEGVSIPEEEIQTFYNNYHKQYNFSESVQFSHIIVDNMDQAEKVISELDQGASFSLLAQEYSIDDETRAKGGYLGYFSTSSQFVPTGYYDIAKEMDEHTYSEPFKVGDGVAIIYLHRILPAYEFNYEELKDHIKNELALNELGQSLTADPLWDEFEIEWVFED